MIYDTLDNFDKYISVHPYFIDVSDFIEDELHDKEEGEYEIGSSGVRVIIESYETRTEDKRFIESHLKYIDVQIVLGGEEIVGIAPKSTCTALPYDEEKDFMKLEGDTDGVHFQPGQFMVFFPEDAHMPKVYCGHGNGFVKKAVFKVPVHL